MLVVNTLQEFYMDITCRPEEHILNTSGRLQSSWDCIKRTLIQIFAQSGVMTEFLLGGGGSKITGDTQSPVGYLVRHGEWMNRLIRN